MNGGYLKGLENYRGPLYAIGVDIDLHGDRAEAIRQLPFRSIYTRSQEYFQLASWKGYFKNVDYCPDLAFYLFNANQIYFTPLMNNFIIIMDENIYPYPHWQEHAAFALKALAYKFDRLKFMILYTGGDKDLRVTESIIKMAGITDKSDLLIPATTHEAISEIITSRIVLSMRFHGIIFATIACTPFLSLANKGKCSLFCEQSNLCNHYLALSEFNDIKLINRINYIMDNQPAKYNLLMIASECKTIVTETLDRITLEINDALN